MQGHVLDYNCPMISDARDPAGSEYARQMRRMFSLLAPRYDLMNRIMTGGQDLRWRREVILRLHLRPADSLLDLGSGTGDLAFEALRQQPDSHPIAVDFSLEMMRRGQARGRLDWSTADALCLPFSTGTFDAAVSGFLMRNVPDIQQVLREQYRVLIDGGRIVILDTTRPRFGPLRPLTWLYMHIIIPLLGGLIAGQCSAYAYLPASTDNFLRAEELSARMAAVGFYRLGFRRLMLGTIAIHWGEK